jgi:hypothetical protein
MYLLPSLQVNFLTNHLELCNLVTFVFLANHMTYLLFFKTIPGIPIDVVAVNYAVFAISI